jgi:acylphosphatase
LAKLHVKVQGRVQGVGFRWFTRVAARRLQLAGWVMNVPDGSVEVAAEGPDEKLAAFRDAISRGPDGAEVTRLVDLSPLDDEPLDFPFKVDKARGRRALNEA